MVKGVVFMIWQNELQSDSIIEACKLVNEFYIRIEGKK